ncbi:uncharacterized protein LODBEIA_P54910 [Lodderomyces beijingensis]|uniref:Calcineurin-like phosphoesterase domain-containing protein n=1 Tax=Lodderomyces beijingensis TaxID=1775926 RepID=A0ABP0ZWB1_9ASCO
MQKVWSRTKRNLANIKLTDSSRLLLILLASWLVVFYINETAVPYWAAQRCHWPTSTQSTSNHQTTTRILLIADPQLIDNHTYPGRNKLLLRLSQHTVDQYLKRNYQALLSTLQPSHILFVGDLLDNGRAASDEYFQHEVARFRSIFPQRPNMYTNVPGNHDIGFGDLINTEIRDRFADTFGEPNFSVEINGVDIVMLDTVSLSSSQEGINIRAHRFLQQLPKKTIPRILLSHVPLSRDVNLSCGPQRERGKFDVFGRGYQYQNSLTPQISSLVMESLQPDLIFSGDDHDYCDVVHESGVREITVKSISMAMGIWYPAVQLLTYTTDGKELNYHTDICYLQTPYVNIAVYIGMAVVCAATILVSNLRLKLNSAQILPLNNYKVNSVFQRGFVKVCVRECAVVGVGAILIYRFLIAR